MERKNSVPIRIHRAVMWISEPYSGKRRKRRKKRVQDHFGFRVENSDGVRVVDRPNPASAFGHRITNRKLDHTVSHVIKWTKEKTRTELWPPNRGTYRAMTCVITPRTSMPSLALKRSLEMFRCPAHTRWITHITQWEEHVCARTRVQTAILWKTRTNAPHRRRTEQHGDTVLPLTHSSSRRCCFTCRTQWDQCAVVTKLACFHGERRPLENQSDAGR